MLRDERAHGLALEFAGNWLDFRRFEDHNAVDRDRFPTFTNELREAMFEEPVRFMESLIRHDGSVLDMLYGDNPSLYVDVNGNPVSQRLMIHHGVPGQGSGNIATLATCSTTSIASTMSNRSRGSISSMVVQR